MKLSVTGAVVRAARASRLSYAPVSPRASSCSVLRAGVKAPSPAAHTVRNLQLNVNYKPPAPNALKAADTRNETDPTRQQFLDTLNSKQPNQTHKEGELSGAKVSERSFIFDKTTNLSPSILNLIDRRLYEIPNHPICITRRLIERVFSEPYFKNHTLADPVVTTIENFDSLGFPLDHPGRSATDTYYVDSNNVLRTHSSAHQSAAFQELASTGASSGFTICADVYRRDSIDRSHFPVFHQMEGAMTYIAKSHVTNRLTRIAQRMEFIKNQMDRLPPHNIEVVEDTLPFTERENPVQPGHHEAEVDLMVQNLKAHLLVLLNNILKAATNAGVGNLTNKDGKFQARWVEAYFPFTSPSFELEVYWEGEWLELLGCGIVQQPILDNARLETRVGWAWGLGIERLAMLLFGIPDIRLFWSEDPRFLSQFKEGKISKFEPFSKFPSCYKDVSFWLPWDKPARTSGTNASGAAAAAGGNAAKASEDETKNVVHENDIMEVVRDIGGTLIESVVKVDHFEHPKTKRQSWCYRINYCSLERTLTNEETNSLHSQISDSLVKKLGVELR